jgi:hypothetical protein
MNEPYKSETRIGDKVLTISGLPAIYFDICMLGAATGTFIGGMFGMAVGGSLAVASPVLVGGAIYKGVRYALRK